MLSEQPLGLSCQCLADLFSRVSNPLGDIPYDTLMEDVELFGEEFGFDQSEIGLIKKGALVAQNPGRRYWCFPYPTTYITI